MPGSIRESVDLEAEEGLLAACLGDPNAIHAVSDLTHWRHFADPKCRLIAEAIWYCLEHRIVVNKPNIAAQLRTMGVLDTVSPAYLTQIDNKGVLSIVMGARDFAKRIAQFAQNRIIADRARLLADQIAMNGEATNGLFESFLSDVTAAQNSTLSARDPRAAAVQDRADQMASADMPAMPTGLAWFDNLSEGGMRLFDVIGLQGRQKGRKTSSVLNLLVRCITNRTGISYFSVDNLVDQLHDGLVCMLATRWMQRQQMRALIDQGHTPQAAALAVDPSLWTFSYRRLRSMPMTDIQRQAYEYARQVIRESNLLMRDIGDGIKNLETSLRLARLDVRAHGSQIVIWDHISDMETDHPGARDNEYRTFVRCASEIKAFAKSEGVVGIAVAQRNEATNQIGGQRVGAGTRYGGKLADVCDYLFETDYDDQNAPEKLTMRLKMGRFSGTGQITYRINPPSGVILNPMAIPAGDAVAQEA